MSPRSLVALAVAAAILFVLLATLVQTGATAAIDRALMVDLHRQATPALDETAIMLSVLGTAPSVFVPAFACVAWALWRRDRAAALAVLLVGALNEGANQLLKLGFGRARPSLWPRLEAAGLSFPSGHAMSAVALFGIMAVVVARLRPGAAGPMWIVTPLVALSIGCSRVVVGVHWPSDVLGGWLAGIASLSVGALVLIRSAAWR